MIRILSLIIALVAVLHGLIHLMGLVAYWPLAAVSDLPYKTSLLGGRLELGPAGMRGFSLLWLLAAAGWVAAGGLLAFGRPAWAPVMLAATLLSLLVCFLDWAVAFRGFWIDLAFGLILLVVFGLRQPPAPFPAYTAVPAQPVEMVAVPSGLPAPVERYYHLVYPDGQMPVVRTAVIDGRGTIRLMGFLFPMRCRFVHIAGQDYRHYIELTFYGYPVFKVNERYLDGHARMDIPIAGVTENEPVVDSAANQGLWAEMVSYPASYLTDGRARWEAVDANTARLHVPWLDGEQVFTAHFDPSTGRLLGLVTMRHRDAKSGLIEWTAGTLYTDGPDGSLVKEQGAAIWADEGTPWFVFENEAMVFNTDVTAYVRQVGP